MKPEDIEDFTEENENEEIEQTNTDSQENGEQSDSTTHSEYKIPGKGEGRVSYHLSGMYQDWFLDYASYVILERAVPHINDGLKPVQRRILHSMRRLDDGRYNKVANIVGHTMQFHPHGDASIGDALVQLGQKDLLIDCQGNWVISLLVTVPLLPVISKHVFPNLLLKQSLIRRLPFGSYLMTGVIKNRLLCR